MEEWDLGRQGSSAGMLCHRLHPSNMSSCTGEVLSETRRSVIFLGGLQALPYFLNSSLQTIMSLEMQKTSSHWKKICSSCVQVHWTESCPYESSLIGLWNQKNDNQAVKVSSFPNKREGIKKYNQTGTISDREIWWLPKPNEVVICVFNSSLFRFWPIQYNEPRFLK